MARIRALRHKDGRSVTRWTPKTGGRPPPQALWEVSVSLGKNGSGRYRQKTERLRGTYTAAKERAAAMEAATAHAGSPEDQGRTLGEALEVYITYAESVKRRATKTVKGYRSIAKTIDSRPLGQVKLRRLSADDLDGYYPWLTDVKGDSPNTVAYHHMLIAQTLTMAIRKWTTRRA